MKTKTEPTPGEHVIEPDPRLFDEIELGRGALMSWPAVVLLIAIMIVVLIKVWR